jgi:hypothetical protein
VARMSQTRSRPPPAYRAPCHASRCSLNARRAHARTCAVGCSKYLLYIDDNIYIIKMDGGASAHAGTGVRGDRERGRRRRDLGGAARGGHRGFHPDGALRCAHSPASCARTPALEPQLRSNPCSAAERPSVFSSLLSCQGSPPLAPRLHSSHAQRTHTRPPARTTAPLTRARRRLRAGFVTLQDVLERFRLSRQCALGIAVQVLRGLHEVHAAGLIHRDVKPANVFLTPARDAAGACARVKLGDFGAPPARARAPCFRGGLLALSGPGRSPCRSCHWRRPLLSELPLRSGACHSRGGPGGSIAPTARGIGARIDRPASGIAHSGRRDPVVHGTGAERGSRLRLERGRVLCRYGPRWSPLSHSIICAASRAS